MSQDGITNTLIRNHMHTISLKHTSFFNRILHLLMLVPGIRKTLSILAIHKVTKLYQELLADLSAIQFEIHHISVSDATRFRKEYGWLLRLLKDVLPSGTPVKPAKQELFRTLSAVIDKLGENTFLMNIIVNGELEPDDQLHELLEDYRDGLLVRQRKAEQYVPWKDIKAKLDAKHNLS